MNFAKKLLASTVASSVVALGASTANAEIELGSGLSVTGFIDMSMYYEDVDGGDTSTVFGVDQVEVDFLYAGSNGVSAQVDIEYGEGDGASESGTFVEQAFITKQFNDQFSVKGGRFLSYSGWETEEPTGLYQYSGTGYGGLFYGGYQQGVSAAYTGSIFGVTASFVNDLADEVEDDTHTIGTELGLALMPFEGLTAKVFYLTESDDEVINFWTSYATGPLTFAFEYNVAEYEDESEADGYLLMGNYTGDGWGFTVRYHDYALDDAAGNTLMEQSAITIAPSFSVGDNLLIVAEYRMDDNGDSGADTDSFALEALFTF